MGASICLRLKASSCRVSEVARSAALAISCAGPRSGDSVPACSSRNSEYPEITISRLLKSCAMPPASRPTASIFWAWRNCCSRMWRSVTSSANSSKKTWLRSSRKARPERRTTIDLPSLRIHSATSPWNFCMRAQVVGQREPLLRIGIEACQIQADQFVEPDPKLSMEIKAGFTSSRPPVESQRHTP